MVSQQPGRLVRPRALSDREDPNDVPGEGKRMNVRIGLAGAAVLAAAALLTGAAAADRKKLFRLSYPMAWGNRSLTPEAFVTGKVTLSKDRKVTNLALEYFDRDDPAKIRKLTTVSAATDRAILRDLGHSLVLSKRS